MVEVDLAHILCKHGHAADGSFELSGADGLVRSSALADELSLALSSGRLDGVGENLVHRAVDEILVAGARPKAMTCQYLGGRLGPEVVEPIADGVASACAALDVALSSFSASRSSGAAYLVGAVLGIRPANAGFGRGPMSEGDRLVGLPGSGLQSSGFALARAILFGRMGLHLDDEIPGAGCTGREALLEVRRSHAKPLARALERGLLHALISTSEGGIADSVTAALPDHLDAMIDLSIWRIPPLFEVLARASGRSFDDLLGELNMGVGMIAVVREQNVERLAEEAPEARVIGRLLPGSGATRFG